MSGLDVHKDGLVVSVAESGVWSEVREYGRITNTAGALNRLMRSLGGRGRWAPTRRGSFRRAGSGSAEHDGFCGATVHRRIRPEDLAMYDIGVDVSTKRARSDHGR